jgi:hypothetical protein
MYIRAPFRSAFLSIAPLGLIVLLAFASGAAPQKTAAKQAKLRYNRDIRPILSDNCFHCHGPDKGTRQADLRLDRRDGAVARRAIAPGKPEQSAIIARVFSTNPDLQMPPPSAHKALTPVQKATLRRWIAEGAEYEPHWAYVVPTRPILPTVKNETWVQNPVDAFVLARLEKEAIAPSPQADKRTLMRRVSLDLTGLPPTPEQVQAFVADTRPDAYERWVDRLLASPAYGERMAVPWLDSVRYADTVGYHGDQNQNAWAYRDYVVDSFNRNKSFDLFTMEQIAGDLLPNATLEQRTATAFNRLTMMTREGGAQPKEYLAKYAGDRVRTVSMAWMGATVGCAECHDHKYDPIKQRDFYALAAFFADVQQWGVYADYGYTPNPDLRGYNNDSPFPPEATVPSIYLQRRAKTKHNEILQIAKQSATQNEAAFTAWRKDTGAFLQKHSDGWNTPAPQVKVASAQTVKAGETAAANPPYTVKEDGRVLLTSSAPATVEVSVQPGAGRVAVVRVQAVPDAANKNSVFRQGIDETTLQVQFAVRRKNGKSEPVAVRHGEADISEPRYANGFAMLGVHRGWKLNTARRGETQTAVYLLDTPETFAEGDTLTATFPNTGAGCVRVSVSPLVPERANATTFPPAYLNTLQQNRHEFLARAFLLGTGENAQAFAQAKKAEAEYLKCWGGKTPVLVTRSVKPLTTRLFPRGNWQDESGPVVEPNTLSFLAGYKGKTGKRLSRLDLARWLVSPQNPLTARVFMNRLWRQFYGNGLSAQVEDLGAQGEWPTHPELLDWLAVEFRTGGTSGKSWDIKRMVRLLVTSNTYKQSSKLRPDLLQKDGQNRLLASQNPRRLEAEFVRDNALAVSGLLNREVGGPPVKPYQPDDYYANLQFPDRDYKPNTDENQYRRGLYTHWQRTFLQPMLAAFDAPSREDAVCTRTGANTPQQALALLNDPTFVEAARVLASRLPQVKAKTQQADAVRVNALFNRVLSRPATIKERDSLLAFLGRVRQAYRERPDDAKDLLKVGIAPVPPNADTVELAAWTSVCRVVLNLHETITRY